MNRRLCCGPWRIPVRFVDDEERAKRAAAASGRANDTPEKQEGDRETMTRSNPEEQPSAERPEAVQTPPPDAAGMDNETLAEIEGRLAEFEDRWKRAAADLDNFRKRFDREIDRLRRAERETVLRAWLAVIDNLERALCVEGASNNPWYEGMEAIHQQMLSVLEGFGVRPDVPLGEKFDPERHDAVAAANLPDKPDGMIVDVIQTGYVLDGKVLRPAEVVAVRKA